MRKYSMMGLVSVIVGTLLLAAPLVVRAQEQGSSGSGDLFGDLVHIKRAADTGQPILQKRWVELAQDQFGWAYCPVPVDAGGAEIPFAPLSCDPDPAYADQLVEMDYFGRLSASRTKERNQRMHFDETIDNIKASEAVDVDEAGRLRLGSACDASGACATWKTVDSPMENLALYRRVMKYGHLQTDPLEEDTSSHGDPALGTVYHPALAPEDWVKFRGTVAALLPEASAAVCFSGSTFVAACALPQPLSIDDFLQADSLLGGAADKTGRVTVDLVQYLNRMLQIPVATPESAATVDTLPALIRDEAGVITPATSDLPVPANERFVDFARARYLRTDRFSRSVVLLQTANSGVSWQPTSVNLLQWLAYANGPLMPTHTGMDAFISGGSDALRVIQFIHEYAVPANLWGAGSLTTTSVQAATVEYRAGAQNVALRAAVTSTTPVNGGTVTFAVQTAGALAVGAVVTSGTVVNGVASATYVVPAGTLPQTLVIVAVYGSTAEFASSTGHGSLVIGQASTSTIVGAVVLPKSSGPQVVPLAAAVSSGDPVPVGTGSVAFTVRDGSNAVIGTPVTGPVTNGVATANYTLPGGLVAQRFTTTAVYGGAAGYATSTGTNVLAVGVTTLSVTSLFSDVSFPVTAGTPVTWTVDAVGGIGPYTYKFNLFDGTSWTVGQDWSLSNTWTWHPALAGEYRVQVWVRNAGSSNTYDGWLSADATVSTPATLTVTSITASRPSTPAGTSVTWTAAAAGGLAPYSFAFWVHDGTSWTLGRDWATSNTWTWTPAAAGSYTFQVWVRNAGTTTSYDAWRAFGPYTATVPSTLTVTRLAADPAPTVAAGTPVTWTATALGGSPPYTFKFYVFDGTSWFLGQDWSVSNTWTWIPPAEGTYTVQVWARNNLSLDAYNAWRGSDGYVITAPLALTVTNLQSDRTSPVSAGTPVVWSARAVGGVGPYTFKFFVFDGTTWSVGQDWSPSGTFTWLAPLEGSYTFQVWLRNAGSTATYDAWLGTRPMVVVAPAALSVVSVTTSPGVPLVTGGPTTITAKATGGTGPYTFQFRVFDGTAWSVGQDWSTSSTWIWTPPAAGTYSIETWVRNAGSVAAWDASAILGPFTVAP